MGTDRGGSQTGRSRKCWWKRLLSQAETNDAKEATMKNVGEERYRQEEL